MREEGLVFDLSARAKLRLTGADRLRYLNGQVSNDLRKATDENAIHGCVLSAKGKINADVFIASEGESFLLESDPGMAEDLTARLDRYIIADDVQIEDVTAEFALLHVAGVDVPELPRDIRQRRAERFGRPGMDLWMKAGLRDATLRELEKTARLCSDAEAETLRIERGLPRWGHELTGEIIPTEANLEASAIDYAKGCYIGQEVISRIKMSGQTNKRLCGLRVVEGPALSAGWRLMTRGEDAKEVGWITSATASKRFGQIGLGFVKRGFQGIGSRLDASGTVVELVALPFGN